MRVSMKRVAAGAAVVALAIWLGGSGRVAGAEEGAAHGKKPKAETKSEPKKPVILDDILLLPEADPDIGPPPLTVKFTGGIYDEDVVKPEFTWDFGDGSPVSHERNPTHTYKTPGMYKVSVHVIDHWKRKGVDEVTVEVEAPTEEE